MRIAYKLNCYYGGDTRGWSTRACGSLSVPHFSSMPLPTLQGGTLQQADWPHKSCPEERTRDITQRLDWSSLSPVILLSTRPHRQLGLASCNDLIPGLLEGLAVGLVLHLLLPLTAHVLTLERASSDAWLPPNAARRLQKNAWQVPCVSCSRLCSK